MAVCLRSVCRGWPWRSVVALAVLGFTPTETLRAALAAAAGTLFEAFPFVLAGALFPRGPVRWVAGLGGCGCRGTPGSAALSLPAFALCWLAFGAQAAWLRVAWLGVFELVGRRVPVRRSLARRTFARRSLAPCSVEGGVRGASISLGEQVAGDLERLALPSLGGALLAHSLTAHPTTPLWTPGGWTPWLAGPAGFVVGAALGLLLPCATSGIALAANLRAFDPSAAAGLIATSGLSLRDDPPTSRGIARPRLTLAAVAAAVAVLVLGGDVGFVNHRLIVPIALAGLTASALVVLPGRESTGNDVGRVHSTGERTTHRPFAFLAPLVMLSALALGSPEPTGPVANTFAAANLGDRVALIGEVRARGTALVRAVITCCRADAHLVGVTLATRDPHADGTWLSAEGTLVERDGAIVLDARHVRVITPPRDPFEYL